MDCGGPVSTPAARRSTIYSCMKWLWIMLSVIGVLLASVVACGAMLPISHIASRQARYRQKPAAIWSAIAREKTFRDANVNYETTESVAPLRMSTRILDKNLPY